MATTNDSTDAKNGYSSTTFTTPLCLTVIGSAKFIRDAERVATDDFDFLTIDVSSLHIYDGDTLIQIARSHNSDKVLFVGGIHLGGCSRGIYKIIERTRRRSNRTLTWYVPCDENITYAIRTVISQIIHRHIDKEEHEFDRDAFKVIYDNINDAKQKASDQHKLPHIIQPLGSRYYIALFCRVASSEFGCHIIDAGKKLEELEKQFAGKPSINRSVERLRMYILAEWLKTTLYEFGHKIVVLRGNIAWQRYISMRDVLICRASFPWEKNTRYAEIVVPYKTLSLDNQADNIRDVLTSAYNKFGYHRAVRWVSHSRSHSHSRSRSRSRSRSHTDMSPTKKYL